MHMRRSRSIGWPVYSSPCRFAGVSLWVPDASGARAIRRGITALPPVSQPPRQIEAFASSGECRAGASAYAGLADGGQVVKMLS